MQSNSDQRFLILIKDWFDIFCDLPRARRWGGVCFRGTWTLGRRITGVTLRKRSALALVQLDRRTRTFWLPCQTELSLGFWADPKTEWASRLPIWLFRQGWKVCRLSWIFYEHPATPWSLIVTQCHKSCWTMNTVHRVEFRLGAPTDWRYEFKTGPMSCFASTSFLFMIRSHKKWKVCNSRIHLNYKILTSTSYFTAT